MITVPMVTLFTIFIILLVMATTITIVDAYPKYKHYRLTYRLLEIGAFRFYHREHHNRVVYRPAYGRYINDKDEIFDLNNTEIRQHLDVHNRCKFICLFHHVYGGPMKLHILRRPEMFDWLDLYSVYWFYKIKRFMDKQGYILDYQWDEYYKIKERKQFKFLRG